MSELLALLNERVLPVRKMLDVNFPADPDDPSSAVMLGCAEIGMALVIVPSVGPDFFHVEIHPFVDGAARGVTELTLRRDEGSHTMSPEEAP